MRLILKLQDLLRQLPEVSFNNTIFCNTLVKGKYFKESFKNKSIISTERPLELLHIHLFGPTRIAFVSGKRYRLVVIDNFTKLTYKDDAFNALYKLLR